MSHHWAVKEIIEPFVMKEYGLKIVEYKEIRKIIKLTTDKGVKVLKKVRDSYPRAGFIYEAMEHARNHGFPNIPPVQLTLEKEIGVKLEDGVLMMIDWIDAREASYSEPMELELTVKALANFHKSAQGLELHPATEPRILYGQWPEIFQKRLEEMLVFMEMAENKRKKTAFDRKIISYTHYFYDWGKRALGHLEESYYPKLAQKSREANQFCHHDMANHNVLLTPQNQVYFIDFDYCIMDMQIHDLASLIIRNSRYGDWDMDKAYGILNSYNKEKPILAEELGVIKAFMEFPQEFWQLGLQYYIEKQPWEKEVFQKRMDRILYDIPKREVFMKRFLV